ncbi:hypothetical protein E2562_017537 [Oryza meyeriana var. granulata]|uniref:Uncharacterized protein n=1 Tax=Oryza meyeriana var. granulata TaxID=110450 RepID=A0A6G1C779_9ORYZ|nr:hypothetical protein E2562_017537 [Oryza meyeriana var. granulata]
MAADLPVSLRSATALSDVMRTVFSPSGVTISGVDVATISAITDSAAIQDSAAIRSAVPDVLARMLTLDTSSSSPPFPASGTSSSAVAMGYASSAPGTTPMPPLL